MATFDVTGRTDISLTVSGNLREIRRGEALIYVTIQTLGGVGVGVIRKGAAESPVTFSATGEALVTKPRVVGGSSTITFGASGSRPARVVTVTASAAWGFTGSVGGCGNALGLTTQDALDAVYNVWGGGCDCSIGCDSPMSREAADRVNAAFQILHSKGKEFGFVSDSITTGLELTFDQAYITMPTNVVAIIGGVTVNLNNSLVYSRPPYTLRPLYSWAEMEAFNEAYRSQAHHPDLGRQYTIPLAFWAEKIPSTNVGEYMRLWLCPKWGKNPDYPDASPISGGVELQLTAHVMLAPPRISCCEPYTRLPIQHRFAESILMPLVRYLALSSRYFSRPEIREDIVAQAKDVLTMLGMIDPNPETKTLPRQVRNA